MRKIALVIVLLSVRSATVPAACLPPMQSQGTVTAGAAAKNLNALRVRAASRLAAVPFAIPVGVPAATINRPQVFYQAQGYSASGSYGSPFVSPFGSAQQHTVTEDVPVGRTEAPAAAALTDGLRKCVGCHSSTDPSAGLDLSNVSGLTLRQRISAVERMSTDDAARRMPKSAPPLTLEELGAAVKALVP